MTNPEQPRERLELIRRRGIQAIGAGISTRNWHTVETAYNEARDMIDALLIDMKRVPSPPSADAAMVEAWAEALCNDAPSRIIADQAEAPCYADSEPHVQQYWQAIARAALDLASRQPAGVGDE